MYSTLPIQLEAAADEIHAANVAKGFYSDRVHKHGKRA